MITKDNRAIAAILSNITDNITRISAASQLPEIDCQQIAYMVKTMGLRLFLEKHVYCTQLTDMEYEIAININTIGECCAN